MYMVMMTNSQYVTNNTQALSAALELTKKMTKKITAEKKKTVNTLGHVHNDDKEYGVDDADVMIV